MQRCTRCLRGGREWGTDRVEEVGAGRARAPDLEQAPHGPFRALQGAAAATADNLVVSLGMACGGCSMYSLVGSRLAAGWHAGHLLFCAGPVGHWASLVLGPNMLICTCCWMVVWLQVGIIGPDKKFKILTSAEVQDYLQEVE